MPTLVVIVIILVVAVVAIILFLPETGDRLTSSAFRAIGYGDAKKRPARRDLFSELDKLLYANEKLTGDMAVLKTTIAKLSAENDALKNLVSDGNRLLLRSFENSVGGLQYQIESNHDLLEQLRQSIEDMKLSNNLPEELPQQVQYSYPRRLFARYPDFQINGFHQSDLSESEQDMVYEVVLDSADTGSYRLVSDRSIRSQLFPMMNTVVKPFCDIDVQSANPQQIEDLVPGLIERSGDSWVIVRKARVSLV